MAKKSKNVKITPAVHKKEPITSVNPQNFYRLCPAWSFSHSDCKMWSFCEEVLSSIYWSEIHPFLRSLETQAWGSILSNSNNKHHFIKVETLNQCAINRLSELHIEAESILSLRLQGQHRLYGYMDGRVFNILWFDLNHGDNDTCVCRSNKKHT